MIDAINKAVEISSWLEHLPPEDVPDPKIWHHDEKIKEHFALLKQKRKNGSATMTDDEATEGTTIEIDLSEELSELRAP